MNFRPCTIHDEPQAIGMACDARNDLLFPSPRMNFAQARVWFHSLLTSSLPPGRHIIAAEDENNRICGFFWLDNVDELNAWLSLAVSSKRHTGRGQEMLEYALRYCFDGVGLHRVSSSVVAGNEPAEKLAANYGTYEGAIREGFRCADGSFRDIRFYGLLESEWRQTYGLRSSAAGNR